MLPLWYLSISLFNLPKDQRDDKTIGITETIEIHVNNIIKLIPNKNTLSIINPIISNLYGITHFNLFQ